MHMAENELSNHETRERLLEAAGEIFAARGFKDATVREICAKAGANVAAVNYHFGDKQGLYSETIKHFVRLAMEKYPPNLGVTEKSTPQERLGAFIRSFLLRVLDPGKAGWYGKLISREMVDPTIVLDERVNDTLRPLVGRLMSIIGEILGPGTSEEQLRDAAATVVGQILIYHHCKPTLVRLFPDLRFEHEQIERLANHITSFTLAGLQSMRHVKG
jgi:AcrR family transcriptional regulator